MTAVLLLLTFASCKKEEKASGTTVLDEDYKVEMSTDKTEYSPGDTITLTIKAEGFDDKANAWVGMVPSEVPHGSEDENDAYDVEYFYIYEIEGGKATFTAPETPGSYDFRLNDSDDTGVEVAYITITVK